MCWCFKVFFLLSGNLTTRICTDLLDCFYNMCAFCCCNARIAPDDATGRFDLVGEATEEFYKEVSREVAEDLLDHKQNGTFIIRPSRQFMGTLSVVQDGRVFHLNLRRRQDGLVALGNEKDNEKCFKDVDSLINYYISNYLVLYSNGQRSQTLLLPYRDKNIDSSRDGELEDMMGTAANVPGARDGNRWGVCTVEGKRDERVFNATTKN
ncbi:hypothetical protein NQ315_001560 [Exocentrus adspersus]|uniref:SH2 domain-containing protein n=1 Tax=Exocentrus adspersus TaxID=1586481 RepID=A0AAV8W8M6_9CUCU|nr:hypothetical protein NQ315_001560 [Exocentrus adspersus]